MSRDRRSGFTLVELLVALALAGLVSLLLAQGLDLTTRGFAKLSRQADTLDRRRGVDAVLRHALGDAAAIPVFAGKPGFIGEPNRLRFLTLAEEGGAGLYRIDIDFEARRPDRPLVLSRRLADPRNVSHRAQSVLAQDLRGVRLAYFGAPSPGDEPGWQAHWEGLQRLPKLVRVTIDCGCLTPRPPLIVRLWNAD